MDTPRCYLDPFREKANLPHIRLWSRTGQEGFHPIYKCFNYWSGVSAFGCSPEQAYANYVHQAEKKAGKSVSSKHLHELGKELEQSPVAQEFFARMRVAKAGEPVPIPDEVRSLLDSHLSPELSKELDKIRQRETIYRRW